MSDRIRPPATLWRRADLVLVGVGVGAGLLLLAAGYRGVSGTRVFGDQVSAARLAGAGVLVTQAGFVVAVLRGRRAIGHRLHAALAGVFDTGPAIPAGDSRPATTPLTGPLPGGRLVAAVDMTRFHRDGCPFVIGKAVTAAAASDHEQAGRRPCGVCRP